MSSVASALAPTTSIPNTAPAPPVLRTLQDTGLSTDQVEQLLVKTLYGGEATGLSLAERVRLPFTMIEPLIERLRAEQLIEVRGSAGTGSASYRYALTDGGRDRGRQYLDFSQYVGPCPVSLAAYLAQMRSLAAARGYIDRERLREGFSHLIISDQVLEQLGPAVNAGKAVFLYGPPGNGKTVIAEGPNRRPGASVRRSRSLCTVLARLPATASDP
jgi:DNA-binding PadR family transcriptional regulator